MGLLLDKLKQIELSSNSSMNSTNQKTQDKLINKRTYQTAFPDLESIPPELSLQILKYLNATDLCLAACVWSSLANDDLLWHGLCKTTWGYASCYNNGSKSFFSLPDCETQPQNYRRIYMQLDEATLTFNADWKKVFGLF
jgi:F-box protein 8